MVKKRKRDIQAELFASCKTGTRFDVESLLSEGAQIDEVDNEDEGNTALLIACTWGNIGVVKLLLDKGADIDILNYYNNTPLWTACYRGHTDLALLLLENGAQNQINEPDSDDETPLFVACKLGDNNTAQLLLDKGADVNLTTMEGETPLMTACTWGFVDIVKLLLKRNEILINMTNQYGYSALLIVCDDGPNLTGTGIAAIVVNLLLDKGAKIDQAVDNKPTPLLIACSKGHTELVEILLERGADVNLTSNNLSNPVWANNGSTPLWLACERNHKKIIALLLDKGADAKIANNNNSTPLSVSCKKGYLATAELVISSNKLSGYKPEHLKHIIHSCGSYNQTRSMRSLSFCMIGYRCYTQLQLSDINYSANEQLMINTGQALQHRQTRTMLSIFFQRYGASDLSKDLSRKATSYLPRHWLGK